MAFFPTLPGSIFRRTFPDPNKLYTPMVNAFNKAIVKLSGKTGQGKLVYGAYVSIGSINILSLE